MPGLNGRGPEGKGSGTGRGEGKCSSRKRLSDKSYDENSTTRNKSRGFNRENGIHSNRTDGMGKGRRYGTRNHDDA
ncbi:DUF5320 domain-containing protein [Saccharicrinis sp. FJH54]|uniref:DUF5320 domain-containing protein n=1 Tax=Saccharicrinis sp. FJH54 TaxID=3344665 RepID=UPI0035D4F26E